MSDQCVRCGFCCRQGVCAFGEWDFRKRQCRFLVQDGIQTRCRKYAEIKALPAKQWISNPAFGMGCSSKLCNTDRERVLAALEEEVST